MFDVAYQNGGFVSLLVTRAAGGGLRFALVGALVCTALLGGETLAQQQPPTGQPPASPASTPVTAAAPTGDAPKLDAPKASPEARKSVTIVLPSEYKSRDMNGDGQIGLYEWGRKDVAKFRSLDANRDGFLTPAELVASSRPQMRRSAGNTFLPTGKGTITPAGAKVVANTVELSSDLKARAAKTFGDLDKDKDGKLTSEEVMSSRFIGRKLKAAGVEVKEPLTADAFAELFAKYAAS